jgi:ubiquitin-protein ligase
MATPEEMRRERLRNDLAEMRRLQDSGVIHVTAAGDPPESYRLNVKVRSIMGPGPTYRGEHDVQVDLPPGYPRTAPQVRMLSMPPPFHPNWFRSGSWCGGDWTDEEHLAHLVLRMVRTLQFDPALTNPGSEANHEAAEWFRRNAHKGLFPCDRTVMPDPSRHRISRRRLELMPDGNQS